MTMTQPEPQSPQVDRTPEQTTRVRSSRTKLFVALGALALIAAVAVGIWFFFGRKPDPKVQMRNALSRTAQPLTAMAAGDQPFLRGLGTGMNDGVSLAAEVFATSPASDTPLKIALGGRHRAENNRFGGHLVVEADGQSLIDVNLYLDNERIQMALGSDAEAPVYELHYAAPDFPERFAAWEMTQGAVSAEDVRSAVTDLRTRLDEMTAEQQTRDLTADFEALRDRVNAANMALFEQMEVERAGTVTHTFKDSDTKVDRLTWFIPNEAVADWFRAIGEAYRDSMALRTEQILDMLPSGVTLEQPMFDQENLDETVAELRDSGVTVKGEARVLDDRLVGFTAHLDHPEDDDVLLTFASTDTTRPLDTFTFTAGKAGEHAKDELPETVVDPLTITRSRETADDGGTRDVVEITPADPSEKRLRFTLDLASKEGTTQPFDLRIERDDDVVVLSGTVSDDERDFEFHLAQIEAPGSGDLALGPVTLSVSTGEPTAVEPLSATPRDLLSMEPMEVQMLLMQLLPVLNQLGPVLP